MFLFVFTFGLIIGSFLNVCIYRIPMGKSIISPPSTCGYCDTRLKFLDLFPIISWVFLGGKCRYCDESISIRYPFIELLTAVLFSLVFWRYGVHLILIPYLNLVSVLILITFTDLDYQIIPNKINLFALIAFILSNLFIGFIPWGSALLGGLIGGGFLFLLYFFTGGAGMGMGDVKLMAVLGLYLGWTSIIVVLLLSFIIGGIFGMLALILKIKERKDAIPFGPWIAISAFLTILYGNDIIRWYINLL